MTVVERNMILAGMFLMLILMICGGVFLFAKVSESVPSIVQMFLGR